MSRTYAEQVEGLAGQLERLAVELDEEHFAEQASIANEAFGLLQGIYFPSDAADETEDGHED
jgi:hypothetical protein